MLSETSEHFNVGWLCWGLTSQSTIFQSYRDGATASWVINQYFRGVKCLAQGHNTAAVGFELNISMWQKRQFAAGSRMQLECMIVSYVTMVKISRYSGMAKTMLLGTVKATKREWQKKRLEDNTNKPTGMEFGDSLRAADLDRERWNVICGA